MDFLANETMEDTETQEANYVTSSSTSLCFMYIFLTW